MRIVSAAPRAGWTGPFQVDPATALGEIHALRERVWWNEAELVDLPRFEARAERLRDGRDLDGLHWVVMAEGEMVGAARLSISAELSGLPGFRRFGRLAVEAHGPVAALNRMVVDARVRREGVSRALTEARLAAARAAGVSTVYVDAVPNRMAPLRELGFTELGVTEPEPWDRIPVVLMVLRLA